MNQKKSHSLVESITNTVVGYLINFVANLVVLPMFGFHITALQSLKLSIVFVLISVARGYFIRRFFNLCHRLYN